MSQVKPTDEILLRHLVTYRAQKRQMSCWYASAKMVVSFRAGTKGIKHSVTSTAEGAGLHTFMKSASSPVTEQPTDHEVGTTEKQWPLVARSFGLVPADPGDVRRVGTNFEDLRDYLVRNGPLWCAGRFFQGGSKGGHVIVITGVLRRKVLGKPKDCVLFHDPAPASLQGGDECVKQYDSDFRTSNASGLYSLDETEGVPPVMYMPAGAKPVTT